MSELTSKGAIVGFCGALLLAVGAWYSVRLWRDEAPSSDSWPLALARAFPIVIAASVLFVGGAALASMFGTDESRGVAGTIFGLVSAVALVAGTGLALSVGFAGRPSSLVPPHLRRPRWDLHSRRKHRRGAR